MAIERTLSIVKPDAVRKNHIGGVLAKLEGAGLTIIGAKLIKLSRNRPALFTACTANAPSFRNSSIS